MNIKPFEFSLQWLFGAAIETVRRPKPAAQYILSLNFPTRLLWQILFVVVIVSVILGLGTIMLSVGAGEISNPYIINPILMAVLQMLALAAMVFATYHIGRLMGGQGTLAGALSLVTWLQLIMVCLQVVQTALVFLMPPVADILGLLGLGLFLWLFTNFIAVLHGFRSLGIVFVMILVSAFGLAFVLGLVLSAF